MHSRIYSYGTGVLLMRKLFWDTWKARAMKYDELTEMAERKSMELKRLRALVTAFPPEGNAQLIINELDNAIEALQKPEPDYKAAGNCLNRANSLLNLEGGFYE